MNHDLTMVFETYEEAADEAQYLAKAHNRAYAVCNAIFSDSFTVWPFRRFVKPARRGGEGPFGDDIIHVYYPEEDA